MENSDLIDIKKYQINIESDTIIINNEKAKFKIGEIDTKKMLGKGSLYDFYTEYVKNKYNIDISKKFPYLDLDIDDASKETFSKFFLKSGGALYIDNYLFLYTNDDYLLVYKDKGIPKFAEIYNNLPQINLPIKSLETSEGVIQLKKIPETYQRYLKLEDYSTEFKGGQLPKVGTEIFPIIISANDNGSGQEIILIYTFSKEFKVTDYLELEYSYEIEYGNVQATFNIKPNYLIEIVKTEYKDNSTKIIETKQYKINDSGKFIEQK